VTAEHDGPRELELARARERHAVEQVALLERALAAAERTAGRTAEVELELAEARAQSGALRDEVAALRRANDELAARLARQRAVQDGLESSVSWRVTRPLRALKGSLGS
jgi:chromosome segregation ATPase